MPDTFTKKIYIAWESDFMSINQSNFIMKCDKRTQNIESSVTMTVQKNIKKRKHKYTGSIINWNE